MGEWGDFPSLGSTAYKEGSEAEQERRKGEECFQSPKGEGELKIKRSLKEGEGCQKSWKPFFNRSSSNRSLPLWVWPRNTTCPKRSPHQEWRVQVETEDVRVRSKSWSTGREEREG